MVPARLNFLLPHISMLMKPIVFALNGSTETALYALKKLESWVENLQPGYFDPLLQVDNRPSKCLHTHANVRACYAESERWADCVFAGLQGTVGARAEQAPPVRDPIVRLPCHQDSR